MKLVVTTNAIAQSISDIYENVFSEYSYGFIWKNLENG